MQKQYRLCRNRQFSYVYHRGKRTSCRDMTLIYARNPNKRIGFSVSKKVGGAVVRNRVKRRMRECMRPLLPELRNGFYVIVAHPSSANSSFQQLKGNLNTMLQKLSLYQQTSRDRS